MKVAVIGAGSTYTPELVSGLQRDRDRLDVTELALMDTDGERLSVVGGLVQRMLAAQDSATRVVSTTQRAEALDGADAVLVQLRIGGQTARLSDETFPLQCGCIGQETTGAGGLAKALRTVPVLLDIAEETARRANPGAWFVDFTNPVGIVTRALLDAGHRAVGLCNFAIGIQRWAAGLLGVDWARVEVDQVGLNHLSWVRAIRLDGHDVLPGLLRDRMADITAKLPFPASVITELGVLPSYYLRYYYAHDDVLAEQRIGPPRAQVVAELERELLTLYRQEGLVTKPPQLEQRGGAHYSEAATALLASLVAGTGDHQVVNVANRGTLPGLADDDVIETRCVVDGRGATPLPLTPAAPELLGLIQHVSAYERLAVQAATSGSPRVLRKALLAHPLIGQSALAADLADRLLAAGAAHLPRFASSR